MAAAGQCRFPAGRVSEEETIKKISKNEESCSTHSKTSLNPAVVPQKKSLQTIGPLNKNLHTMMNVGHGDEEVVGAAAF